MANKEIRTSQSKSNCTRHDRTNDPITILKFYSAASLVMPVHLPNKLVTMVNPAHGRPRNGHSVIATVRAIKGIEPTRIPPPILHIVHVHATDCCPCLLGRRTSEQRRGDEAAGEWKSKMV